jgi:proteasome accessory factor C
VSRTRAAERLARLLAIVPWVVARDGPTVAEVCRRFAISEHDLLADLNLLFMCGLYPYTPDSLIEVDVDDGRVWVRFADWFRRPLRLSAPEGLALVAAARATLGLPASVTSEAPAAGAAEPLARALAKLETVLGPVDEEALDIELGRAPEDVLGPLQGAVAQHRKVRLEYYSFGRDAVSERVVQPWRVFSSEGHWYLLGWCETAGGRRLFRVDRARSATVLEGTFEPPGDVGPLSTYEGGEQDPMVVLDLAPGARWVAEQYPNEGVAELGDGHLELHLRASSRAWLERLLLRAGPEVTVLSGAEGVRDGAARRLLALYGHVTSGE